MKTPLEVILIQTLGVPRKLVRQRFAGILPGHVLIWKGSELAEGKPLADLVGSAKYLITGSLPIDGTTIRNCALAMISVSFTGYDHVDLAACKEKGIAVYNTPGYSTDSVAELSVGLALSLLRNIPKADAHARQPELNWFGLPSGAELRGKTVGIVGTGATGMAAARLFAAFGCKLLGYNRGKKDEFEKLGGTYCDLKDLLKGSDIVSLHLALSAETRHIMNAERIAELKPTSYLINTARGGLVDEAALAKALNNGELAGAGLDVFGNEPPARDNPLLTAQNTALTPHLGYKTQEALLRKLEVTFRNISDFEKGIETNRVA
ncbi:hydroxyacid dehydrogenase [candidate division TA06 bacterium]|uniref:Hydroxyacid dehydrogenase n=1 Tax=candidate division TA06 bacterium TaxID=2250710 RepID=A0A933MJ57_UNCT6|nr:hydroxyacid dehydrogenase [candidate division TA06 bacterium]